MWKKHKIIILPTKDKSPMLLIGDWHKLVETQVTKLDPDESYQHLYILSDEEIKEGEWFYDSFGLRQARWNTNGIGTKPTDGNDQYKIIATTDNALTILRSDPECINEYYLPFIPQSFISLYIEKYNKGEQIKEVEVEHEEVCTCSENTFRVKTPTHLLKTFCPECVIENIPKIDSNNNISIKRNKESYSRQEVIDLLYSVVMDCDKYDLDLHYSGNYKNLKEWIEQNL